ncbi:MAG: hypothetical protein J3R72DRAFT_496721 [Linnemannia gamsii]|nr:MAG: hypothetical protein J3R72DRAFT_496721 [Linnemannia gamsii]
MDPLSQLPLDRNPLPVPIPILAFPWSLLWQRKISTVASPRSYSSLQQSDGDLHSTLTTELRFGTTRTYFNPTRFNYLGYVRRLDLVQFMFIEYDAKGSRKEVEIYSEDKLKYIRGEELGELHQEERRDACCTTHSTMDDQLMRYYSNILYREAIWSLATPILGQLESLTFPLSDIHRYIQIVNQLGRLEHAVVLDIPFHWICCQVQVSEATRLRREEAVQDVVQFVEDHRRIFPGCLKGFLITANVFWPRGYTAVLSLEIDLMVSRILPYHKPKYLAPVNWARIVAHRQTTDLGSVHSILGLDPSVVDRQLLQQCRALKELSMVSLVDGCFDWSVQEKRDIGLGQGPSVSNNGDAMAFAFSQTLMDLQVDLHGADHVETIGFGRSWVDLPVLSHFQLRAPRHRLASDPLLLTHCPSLMFVTLKDETFEYSSKDVVRWLPAQLPKLRHLCLRGWGALIFSLNIPESTKEFMILKLNKFLALPDAIARALWTWDRDLPILASLTLTSEFAYRFQFRILQGCQALEKLHLNMRTIEGDHTRAIIEADLFVSGVDGSHDRFGAPNLQKLYMNGHWVF